MKDITIYGLIDPRTMKIKYIGQTNNIVDRYDRHLYSSITNKSRYSNWIATLRFNKLEPILVILDTCSIEERYILEEKYIKLFSNSSNEIVNTIHNENITTTCNINIVNKRYSSNNIANCVSLPNSIFNK